MPAGRSSRAASRRSSTLAQRRACLDCHKPPPLVKNLGKKRKFVSFWEGYMALPYVHSIESEGAICKTDGGWAGICLALIVRVYSDQVHPPSLPKAANSS